jgi:nitrous oxidase accessory protein NosD
MKTAARFLLGLGILLLFTAGLPAGSKAHNGASIACGQTITEDTTLEEDLACPAEAASALVIAASNITLDLGGHTISGYTPNTGVYTTGQSGLTIRNGVIEGFNVGVYIDSSNGVTVEDLTVRNMDITDPDHFLFGIAIVGSQAVVVRDSLFEFPVVAHKEAVEVFDSTVEVYNIEVRGGGAGVSFSFLNDTCDPLNHPSNGTVRDNIFSDVYVAGVWIACTSSVLIEGNDISGCPDCILGIQADGPFPGAVTGLTVKGNTIHDTLVGIEYRGVLESTIASNYVYDNGGWGIALRQSLGCLAPQPGWECFNSTANLVVGNQTWGNVTDLYHYEEATGNTWTGNACKTKDGAEIPECSPPEAAMFVNYAWGKPGSFFTVTGANFPPNSTAVLMINDLTLGSVPTDADGGLAFLLDTAVADQGAYTVTASAETSASASFLLISSSPLRLQEGSGTVFVVPAGLAAHWLYLPLVRR